MDGMIRRLRFFLESNGISAYHFNCKHCPVCKDGNPNFVGATEPYIGVNYIKNEFPRILFVSLDPGSADRNPDKRKLVVTENVESDEYNPFLFHNAN